MRGQRRRSTLYLRATLPERDARLMGHSLQVHEQTYKRWLDIGRIREAMRGHNL